MIVSCIEKHTPSRASTIRRDRQVSAFTSRSVSLRSSKLVTITAVLLLGVCGGWFAEYQGDFLAGDFTNAVSQDVQAAFQDHQIDVQGWHEFDDFVFWTGSFHQQAFFKRLSGDLACELSVFETQTSQQTATFDAGAFNFDGDLGQSILDHVDDLGEVTVLECVISPVAAQCSGCSDKGWVATAERAVVLTW